MSDPYDATTAQFPAFRTPVPPAPEGRPKLVVLRGGSPGSSFELTRLTTIGRSSECEIHIQESSISRWHARISERADGRFEVEDLQSRNGVWVDGHKVERATLRAGTRIDLGQKVTLLFTLEDPLERELRERQKMEAIGRMAAGIAHDFNNVVGAAQATLSHLESLLGALPDALPDEARDCMDDLTSALDRSVELTRSLATLGRREDTPRALVALDEVCQEVARLCRRTFRAGHQIQCDAPPDLFIFGSQTELHQVLLNLCINARDAMPEGGRIAITASKVGTSCVVRVRDTGVGMAPQTLERAFEPFFTTKPTGRGTGLGLATVAELVRGMGGSIDVESELGRGTSFRIGLPLAAPPRPEAPPSPAKRTSRTPSQRILAPGQRGAHILVADDQELVRRSLGRLLVAAGHEVTFAADGEEALRVYRESQRKPDLVLVDLDMPGLTGRDVIEVLGGLPNPPAMVVISGHWDPTRRAELIRLGAAAYLAKPVDASVLRRTVASLVTPSAPVSVRPSYPAARPSYRP
ncbi:MAG: ATP-binding protein [Sandaracinaceae bacterium]